MKLAHWAFTIALFTASFDTFLAMQVGGTVRIAQLMMLVVSFAAMARVVQDGRILWPRGLSALALWLMGQAVCLPLSGVISIGLQFFVVLLFTCGGILAVVQLYGLGDMIQAIMKIYMLSYVFVAGYGLFQFAAPLFGFVAPFTAQWLVHGKFARINAFSYEPSYFATYICIGWVMLIELRMNKARIADSPFWKWATIAVSASLLLSSSKTGWLVMIAEGLSRLAPLAREYVGHTLHHTRQGRWLLRLPGRRSMRIVALAGLLGLVSLHFINKLPDPTILLAGSGLANTPAHSINDRSNAASATFAAFLDSPFIGRSLGGVPIYMAARNGVSVNSIEEVRAHWGFPVLLEVLVASGLIGYIPFLVFLYTNTFGAFRFATRYMPQERAKWLRALSRAMIFEWLMLMGDQNLLRTPLWLHFAMVTLVAYHLEFAPAALAEPRPVTQSFSSLEASPAT